MQKRLAIILMVIGISGGLLACGSKSADVSEPVEVTEASPTPEKEIDSSEAKAEETEEPNQEPETEKVEEEPKVENVPTWYMDAEGLKSEELGIMIRRDSAEWEKFGFAGSVAIVFKGDNSGSNFRFECNYYEGDIDSYISENAGMEKATLENIVYAVREMNEISTEAVFVGNGVTLSIDLFEYGIEDIWENGLSYYEEDNTDYLAYVRDKVLYCPALGIKFAGNAEDAMFDEVGIGCSDRDSGVYEGGEISISNGMGFGNNESTEEKLQEYVNNRVKWGESVIEEDVEEDLGNYKYIGKGSSDEYGTENWFFASDETSYEIFINYSDKYELENYLSLIEELK